MLAFMSSCVTPLQGWVYGICLNHSVLTWNFCVTDTQELLRLVHITSEWIRLSIWKGNMIQRIWKQNFIQLWIKKTLIYTPRAAPTKKGYLPSGWHPYCPPGVGGGFAATIGLVWYARCWGGFAPHLRGGLIPNFIKICEFWFFYMYEQTGGHC